MSFLRPLLGVFLYNQINWSLLQIQNMVVVEKRRLNLTQYESRVQDNNSQKEHTYIISKDKEIWEDQF
jgi:hypothetical protein